MLWYGAIFLFITGTMFSFMMDGVSGLQATNLSASVSATSQYIPVTSVSGFKASDVRLMVGNEEMSYTSLNTAPGTCGSESPPCFDTGILGWGYNETTAAAHSAGARAYSESTGLLNEMVAFRTGEIGTAVGTITFPITAAKAFGKFMAKAVMWDYSFLEGNGIYIKMIFLYPLSGMMVLAFARLFSQMIGFLLGRV